MNPHPAVPDAGSTNSSTVTSVVVGVVLGALVTFSVTLYNHKVDDQRLQRERRVQHLERMMNAAGQTQAGAIAFFGAIGNLLVQAHIRGNPPDVTTLLPSWGPITEMNTVTALYLPEVETESRAVADAYTALWMHIMVQVAAKAKDYHPGDPIPQFDFDKSYQTRFDQALNNLRAKLRVLAQQLP